MSADLKCFACTKNISQNGKFMNLTQEKVVHSGCWKCGLCQDSLTEGKVQWIANGKTGGHELLCENCGEECFKCGEWIVGSAFNFEDKYFHSNCLSCAHVRLFFKLGNNF